MKLDFGLDKVLGIEQKKKRKAFPKTIKDAVLKLQDGKCKKCGKKFTSINKAQFDHKNGKNWDNSFRNCQALHAGCHDAKSRSATKKRATTKKKIDKDPFGLGNVDSFFGKPQKKKRKSDESFWGL